jgi:hypothetical protein
MHPIAALMLSGAIEEERRRGPRLRRRWLDAQDELAATEILGRRRPLRHPRLPEQSSSTK